MSLCVAGAGRRSRAEAGRKAPSCRVLSLRPSGGEGPHAGLGSLGLARISTDTGGRWQVPAFPVARRVAAAESFVSVGDQRAGSASSAWRALRPEYPFCPCLHLACVRHDLSPLPFLATCLGHSVRCPQNSGRSSHLPAAARGPGGGGGAANGFVHRDVCLSASHGLSESAERPRHPPALLGAVSPPPRFRNCGPSGGLRAPQTGVEG